jgi:hypothetical protein
MSGTFVWCGIMTPDLDTKLLKNAGNFQVAELRWIFAESTRTFAAMAQH